MFTFFFFFCLCYSVTVFFSCFPVSLISSYQFLFSLFYYYQFLFFLFFFFLSFNPDINFSIFIFISHFHFLLLLFIHFSHSFFRHLSFILSGQHYCFSKTKTGISHLMGSLLKYNDISVLKRPSTANGFDSHNFRFIFLFYFVFFLSFFFRARLFLSFLVIYICACVLHSPSPF